ncbi:hypothetical protein B0A55_00303 [Friedmanniomyces simplex]|uniref:dCMP deaminase n=1 Tax=Friedmanniomyces simplex TaxID=329884 RepID=A0A4U0Y621_9PEZI|nr:hypothetical protein B0A55_00303 [Friedmanniomyces simplex]
MLIGICGSICAGKHSVQNYLIERHGFEPLDLVRNYALAMETSASQPPIHNGQSSTTPRQPFATVNDLVDFATQNWRHRFCTTSIQDEATVEALCHRPFFLLLHIDAPLSTRWQRFKARCTSTSTTPPTLEQFVQADDAHLYNPSTGGLAALASRAQINLLNSTTSLPNLHSALDALNLTDESRLRPTWDHYFMTLASLAARRSNCMRRQVGCVLVRANRVIATGYNGTPRHITNCNAGGCPRCNDGGGRSGVGLSTCLCLHAEENALLEAGRERIVQVGITEVVFNRSYYMDADTAKIFREAGVQLRQFSPPKEGLVKLVDEPFGARHISVTTTFQERMGRLGLSPVRAMKHHRDLQAQSSPAFLHWRLTDPASKEWAYLSRYRMLEMWGPDGALIRWGHPPSDDRQPVVVFGPGLFDWCLHSAQPIPSRPTPESVYPQPRAQVPPGGMQQVAASPQPSAANALTVNRAAANGVVAKRPAASPATSQPANKRARPDRQTQGRVLDLARPLANVSKTAKAVYKVMVSQFETNGARDVTETVLTVELFLEPAPIHEACVELRKLGLIVKTSERRDWYVPVPLGTWRERQEE